MKTETSIVCVMIWCENTPEIMLSVLKGDEKESSRSKDLAYLVEALLTGTAALHKTE